MAFFTWLVIIPFLPPPFYTGQEALQSVLGQVPRIVVVSLGLLPDKREHGCAFIFTWFNAKIKGRRLWSGCDFSSIPAMALDSAVFINLAFYGVVPIMPLVKG